MQISVKGRGRPCWLAALQYQNHQGHGVCSRLCPHPAAAYQPCLKALYGSSLATPPHQRAFSGCVEMQTLLQGQMGAAWGAHKGWVMGISLTQAALMTGSPHYEVPAIAVFVLQQGEALCPSSGHMEKEPVLASSKPGFPFPSHLPSPVTFIVLHGSCFSGFKKNIYKKKK